MGFGELCLVIVVAIVVVGPKDLPRFLRKAGQLAGKLRRMASDVRAQSGIDEVLRTEGLTKDIAEIRRLAQGDFVDPIRTGLRATAAATSLSPALPPAQSSPYSVPDSIASGEFVVSRDREYPLQGADGYSAIPDTAIIYAKGLPLSSHAHEPLYVVGDANAPLPPPVPEPEPLPDAEAEPEPEHSAEAAPTSPKPAEESSASTSLPETGTA
jgi:sec-independent protein translocase protein TatB